MKPASQITDRAKRYRAQRNHPPGPKRCNFCGSRKNIDIDHITGNEADEEADNLMYLCRTCNASKAVQQARNRIGVRTRQYNPQRVPSLAQFRRHAAVLLGLAPGDVATSTAAIRATPPATRAQYANNPSFHVKHHGRGPDNMENPVPTFQQYGFALGIHRRKAHDEGGSIIHATPPAVRSRYAKRIASIKRQRGTDQRRGDVPF